MSQTAVCEIIILILYVVKYKGVLMLCCMTFPKQLPLRFFDNWIIFPKYYFRLFVSFVYLKTINSFLSEPPQLYNDQIYYILIECIFS